MSSSDLISHNSQNDELILDFVPEKLLALKKSRETEDESPGGMAWLVTFTDIIALMLTFFVLMYSMSEPREKEWERIAQGFSAELKRYNTPQWNRGDHESINIQTIDFSSAQNLDYLASVLKDAMVRDKNLQMLEIYPQDDHLIVSVPEHVLFEKQKLQISEQGRLVLSSLAMVLNRIRNRIEIIGHSDPFSGESRALKLSSDWELSLLKAGAVMSVFRNVGYSREILFRGYSSGRYSDISMNLQEPEKRALSQKIDIVINKDDGSLRSLLDIEGKP